MRQPTTSLAQLMAERDSLRFVGRVEELEFFDAVLEDDDPPASLVLVHGPGGIGKSALLREVGRRAERRGFLVRTVDGRTVAAMSDEVGRAAGDLVTADRPLLMVDSYERAEALGAHLRDHVLPALPATTRVVIGGRNRPDPAWFSGGWEAITRGIELSPLTQPESRRLLKLVGVRSSDAIERIATWADGEPLALVVGAEASDRIDGRPLADLADLLTHHLVGDEIAGMDHRVVSVAALAPAVDALLLGDVVDGIDANDAIDALRRLSFSEPLGDRVTFHERIRWSLRSRLVRDEPTTDSELRRRLADHFHDRAKQGDVRYLLEFGSLFRDDALRWGWVADGRGAYQIDRARTGDEEAAAAALGAADTAWWKGIRRWFHEAPQAITVVRDTSGHLAGFCIFVTPGTAPPWAADDVVLGPRLAHARERYPEGNVVLWRDAFGFPPDEDGDPARPLMMAVQGAIIGSGRIDSLCTYGSVVVGDPLTSSLADAYGAIPEPSLKVVDGERSVEGRILHHGHGGFIGAARARVYQDLGLEPPPPDTESLKAAVQSALRAFHDPLTLATNPLATGDNPHERADSLRRLISEAVAEAFGSTPGQILDRSVIEAGYLTPGTTHEAAARDLHLGRSTYFRHLSQGVERITAYLASRPE